MTGRSGTFWIGLAKTRNYQLTVQRSEIEIDSERFVMVTAHFFYEKFPSLSKQPSGRVFLGSPVLNKILELRYVE